MEIKDLLLYIPSYLLIVIAAIYLVGYMFKMSEIVKDKYIPLWLMVVSITAGIIFTIINGKYKVIFDAIAYGVVYGILCWGVAIGLHQTQKQLKKDE